MREIKFRAWDKKRKKMWSHWNLYCMDCSNEYPFLALIKGYYATNMFPGEEMDIEIMQYTGLKDKNGKEIYEGDIVRWKHKDATEHEYIISVVKWFGDEGYPAFDLEPNDGADCNALSLIFQSREYEIEVIGNVFENPWLMEAKGNARD